MQERYAAVVALLAAKKHLCVLSCLFASYGFFLWSIWTVVAVAWTRIVLYAVGEGRLVVQH